MDEIINHQGATDRFIMGPDHEHLHRHASRLAAEWIALPLADFWRDLHRAQQALDVSASDYTTHRADLHALEVLQRQQDDWQLRLRMALESRALAWRSHQRPKERSAAGLTLMSEIELSAQLETQQSILALQKSLKSSLDEFDARINGFAFRLGLRPDAGNPWGVEAVVQAFAETLPLDEFSPTLVPIAFRAFRERLGEVLKEAWPRLLALLEGVAVPVLDPVVEQHAPTPSAPVEPDISTWLPQAERRDGHMAHPALPASPSARPYLQAVPTSPLRSLPQAFAQPSFGAPPGIAEVSPANGSMEASLGAMGAPEAWPMPRYRDIVHSRLSQWRERVGEGGGSVERASAHLPHVFRFSEVIAVASMLQGEDPAPFAAALSPQARTPLRQVVREQMLKAAGQFGFDPDNASFSADEEDAIDLVSLLFSTLANQNDLMPRGERMLGKLVMPYVKVAMLDDSLFNRRVHPARRLLDGLAETCDGNAGETLANREMLDRAERIVEEVVARFQEDQAIFELAAQELHGFLDQQRRRAELSERRLAEALHGRERLQFARRAAHQALAASIARGPLCVGSFTFMESFLQKALVQAWLRHGEDSKRYRSLVALGDEIARLDGLAAAQHSHELAQGFAAQLEMLRECLSLSGQLGDLADEAIARLLWQIADPQAARVQRTLPPLGEEEPGVESVGPQPPALRVVGGTDLDNVDPTLVARLRKLRVGQGLRIREEDGRESAARVAWISPLTSRFLIVNRRGVRRMVASAESLARLVEQGQVSIRAVDAPVDHAMRRIWEELAPQAGAGAA